MDVLVIGAGITGALVAQELTSRGARVAIMDRRRPALGSTPASTALLQYEIDTPLVTLTKQLGEKHARDAYRASLAALSELDRVVGLIGDSGERGTAPRTRTTAERPTRGVDLVSRQSLQLAVTSSDLPDLRAEVRARTAAGISCSFLSRSELRSRFGLDRPGAILNADAREVNPLKLTYALLKTSASRGAVMIPRSRFEVEGLDRARPPFRVVFRDGSRLTASRIVIATGYETPEQFAMVRSLTTLVGTYALTTRPLKSEPWPGRVLLWDAGDPYFYARTTADNRIMIGGEDEPFTTAKARDSRIPVKCRVLMGKVRALLPHVRVNTQFRWAGTFAKTDDGLPYIGEHPRWPGVAFALGYGGNGITFSVIASKIIAAWANGQSHPHAELFRFDRRPCALDTGQQASVRQ